jgi:hypothetical protein
MVTVGSKAAGGTARWNSRPGVPPICCSARAIASTSGKVWTVRAGEREPALERLPGRPGGLDGPEFGDGLAGKVAELFVGQAPAGGADDRHLRDIRYGQHRCASITQGGT